MINLGLVDLPPSIKPRYLWTMDKKLKTAN